MEIRISCIKCGGREFCVSLLTLPAFQGIILLRCTNCGRKTLYKVIEDETITPIPEKENAYTTIYKEMQSKCKKKKVKKTKMKKRKK